MKLRLFQVARRDGKPLATNSNTPTFFVNKREAKQERNALGEETHKVVCGPDHRRYKT